MNNGDTSKSPYDHTSKLQAQWEEMNRREKMDRYFRSTFYGETDRQKKERNDEKSKEEQRRVQWDLNQESQSTATAAGYSTAALKTNEKPTALATPDIRRSKSRRGFSEVQKLVTKPWTKAPKASGVGEHKEGKEKNEKKQKKENKKNEKKQKGKKKKGKGKGKEEG